MRKLHQPNPGAWQISTSTSTPEKTPDASLTSDRATPTPPHGAVLEPGFGHTSISPNFQRPGADHVGGTVTPNLQAAMSTPPQHLRTLQYYCKDPPQHRTLLFVNNVSCHSARISMDAYVP